MRIWALTSVRNPLWRQTGLVLLLVTGIGTGFFIYLGPRSLKPKPEKMFNTGIEGRSGTYTELLGKSRFLLAYETILGGENSLQLKGVKGRLEEPETLWLMNSPSARKSEGVWWLDGPMNIEAREPKTKTVTGKGWIEQAGPGLKWDHDVWTGMSTLVWEDLQEKGKGRWTFPPGWTRELDGRFVVENKTVRWEAMDAGALRTMEAQSLWVTQGFLYGHLVGVHGVLTDGTIQAAAADIDPATIQWVGPIRFQRNDGWLGNAQSGAAPRPEKGGSIQMLDLRAFDANRKIPEGTESIHAEGARWTPAGIRAEGNVQWDQPKDEKVLTLRAPRVLMREGVGEDLPADLPIGEARAEGMALLTWADRTLSSPTMQVKKADRSWIMQAPVLGRSDQGTFSAGAGTGRPDHWEFEGPIRANMPSGGSIRGDRLTWDNATWTIIGRPATWNGLRERLSGPKMIRKDDLLQLPDGITGSYTAPDGDVAMRADRGESQAGMVKLNGRVDCQGQGWRLQSDQVSVQLGPDNHVKTITAKGSITLKGSLSQGKGEYLMLDLENRIARWQGQVKGLTEVQP